MNKLKQIKKEREFVPDFMYIQSLEDYCEKLEESYNESLKTIKRRTNKMLNFQNQLIEETEENERLRKEKRHTYVTIEGEQSDIAKDLKKFIIENDSLKQDVDRLNEQINQCKLKLNEHYENMIKIHDDEVRDEKIARSSDGFIDSRVYEHGKYVACWIKLDFEKMLKDMELDISNKQRSDELVEEGIKIYIDNIKRQKGE